MLKPVNPYCKRMSWLNGLVTKPQFYPVNETSPLHFNTYKPFQTFEYASVMIPYQ